MSSDTDKVRTRFETFAGNAFVEVVLPKHTDLDAVATLRTRSYEDVQHAPQRRHLFFDERVSLTIIARCTTSEDDVHTLLPGLDLSIAAHATNAVPESSGGGTASASGKYDLVAKTLSANDTFEVVVKDDKTYIIWKTTLHIPRPRVKLNRPAIYFTVSIAPERTSSMPTTVASNEVLDAFDTQPINVLEPLRSDPTFASSNIYLSETRITKVSPTAPSVVPRVRPLRGASRRAFPIVPAVFTRLRSSPVLGAVIVSLHLEASPLVAGTISVGESELKLRGAVVEPLLPETAPLQLAAGDEGVLLYKVTPEIAVGTSEKITLPPPLDLRVKAGITLADDCEALLDMRWQSPLDLSKVQSGPKYKWSRPLSTPSQFKRRSVQSVSRGKSLDIARPSSGSKENGILFNFTAPPITHQGNDLAVQVQCINHSTRSRRFGIIVLPPSKTVANNQATMHDPTTSNNVGVVAAALAAKSPERPISPSVIDLNPDLRIGPLPPGACYETKMEFHVLSTGVLDLGTFRIVDLDTGQTVDVKDVPDVVSIAAGVKGDAEEQHSSGPVMDTSTQGIHAASEPTLAAEKDPDREGHAATEKGSDSEENVTTNEDAATEVQIPSEEPGVLEIDAAVETEEPAAEDTGTEGTGAPTAAADVSSESSVAGESES